jgi:DNA-binding PadR family transcriptional regulator
MTTISHNMTKRSPLALAVLVLLYEQPMHVYRMQQLIKERGKDEVINVTQRNNLYQIIARLERDGLIVIRATESERSRPERVIYELTNAGRGITLEWTREILSTPSREFPEFPAAVSVLPVLSPQDALEQLEKRIIALEIEVERYDSEMKAASFVPRLFLLEIEYLYAQMSSELRWVIAIADDLRSGRLTWDDAWLSKVAKELAAAHGQSGE